MISLTINWGNAEIVTLLGFGTVFLILVLLIGVIWAFGSIMAPTVRAPKTLVSKESTTQKTNLPKAETDVVYIPALHATAIATALHMFYGGLHDVEPNVITIKKVERKYSPWSSKIYGFNNLNR